MLISLWICRNLHTQWKRSVPIGRRSLHLSFLRRQWSRQQQSPVVKIRSLADRCIHLSSINQALHPVAWLILRPLLKGGIFIIARFNRHRIYEWLKRNKRLALGILGGFLIWSGAFYYQHIETTPITNRRRFVTLNTTHLRELSQMQANMLLSTYNDRILPAEDTRTQRVVRVVKRLLNGNMHMSQVHDISWRVHVVDSDESNAFVLPNGDIFFLTGMFRTVENDDQLAIIMAHELAHAVLGHSLEMMSWARFLDWFLLAGAGFLAVIVPGTFVAAWLTDQIMNKVIQITLQLPYNRKLESEADEIGLTLAASACYDTRESFAYWLNLHMQRKLTGEIDVPTILSTHPNHGVRAERLSKLIEPSLRTREGARCPPLKRCDPRVLADAKRQLIERELAL